MDDGWGLPSEQADDPVLAGRGRRLVAVLLNGALFGLLPFALAMGFAPHAFDDAAPVHDEQTGLLVDPNAGASVAAGAIFLGAWLIFGIVSCILIARNGQSIGKAAVGIRVIQVDGRRAGFWRIFGLRWFVVMLSSSLIGLIGIVDILFIFRGDRRCLHDLLAGTIVVMDGQPDLAPADPHRAGTAAQRPAPAVANVVAPPDGPAPVPFARPDSPPAW